MSIDPLLCFLLLTFFLCFHGGQADFAPHCSDVFCHGVLISYPFWKIDDGSTTNGSIANVSCGYPGFGLSCDASNPTDPVLTLPSDNYYVKDINYTNQSITLVDIDVVGRTCPRAKHNVTVDTLPLDFNPDFDVNITFYFNCSFDGVYAAVTVTVTPVTCLGTYSGKQSYVFLQGTETEGLDWAGSCEDIVVATVRKTEVSESELISQFTKAMNTGFMLDWDTAKECGACEQTKGRCGFNNRTKEFLCFCDDKSIRTNGTYCKGKSKTAMKIGIGIVFGSIVALVIVVAILLCCLQKCTLAIFKGHSKIGEDIERFIRDNGSLSPIRFSYSRVKRMTNSFREKLGRGGFGSVYRGKLPDGTVVAVKLLDSAKGSGEDFINEVASISRTSHVNIVTLLGFCFEGNKRALIYEFMPNGSLDRFLHNENATGSGSDRGLGWQKLCNIAVGIARGLEYLHQGCNTRILHFDIKPQNILLDKYLNPKISDFGLSKLCRKRESIVSMLVARGTIGYIAPEVFSRNFGRVSYKSDVYSYGMMLIEMIGERNNLNVGAEQSSEIYFTDHVYRLVEQGYDRGLHSELREEEEEIARKMALVGVWCIQSDPTLRPSMSGVIEMLEGTVEALQIPPKPFLFSPHRSPKDSTCLDETDLSD